MNRYDLKMMVTKDGGRMLSVETWTSPTHQTRCMYRWETDKLIRGILKMYIESPQGIFTFMSFPADQEKERFTTFKLIRDGTAYRVFDSNLYADFYPFFPTGVSCVYQSLEEVAEATANGIMSEGTQFIVQFIWDFT